MRYRQGHILPQNPPPKQWGNGWETRYNYRTKIHEIYRNGEYAGQAFFALVDWSFTIYGHEFYAGNLPEGMERVMQREA